MLAGIIFDTGVGGRRAELDQLPRHGPQIAGSDKTLMQLNCARRRGLLTGRMTLFRRRLLLAARVGGTASLLLLARRGGAAFRLLVRGRGALGRKATTLQ